MSLNLSLIQNFDFYSPNIGFLTNGKEKNRTFTGLLLSSCVVGTFFMFMVQYILFFSSNNLKRLNIEHTNYTNLADKYKRFYNYNPNEFKILISSNLTEINYQYNVKNTFLNPDDPINAKQLIYGFLIYETDTNKIINLQSDKAKLSIVIENSRNIDNNLNVSEYGFDKCKIVFDETHNSSIYFRNNDLIYFDNYQCISDLKIIYFKDLYSKSQNFTDSKISFNIDICQKCLKIHNIDINNVSINFFYIENLEYLNGKLKLIPFFYKYNLNEKFTKVIELYYETKYFFFYIFKIFWQVDVPYHSSLDVSEIKNYEIPSIDNTRFKIIMNIKNDVLNQSYTYQGLINDIGMLGNIFFFLYFFGKIMHYFLGINKTLDHMMNEIFYIIDPENNDAVRLIVDNQKHNFQGYGEMEINNVKEFFEYKEIIEKDGDKKINKEKEENSQRHLINKIKNNLIKNNKYNQADKMSNIKKVKKICNKKIKEYQEKIKERENLIYNQINRYNLNEYFKFNLTDKMFNNYKEKKEIYLKARKYLYINSDMSNVCITLNSFKFLILKILFNECQYFLLNIISPQIIMGDYIIGFINKNNLSRVISYTQWCEKNHNLRRSIKKIRKNEKFSKYDKKFLHMLNLLTQENLITNFVDDLNVYFREFKKLK